MQLHMLHLLSFLFLDELTLALSKRVIVRAALKIKASINK